MSVADDYMELRRAIPHHESIFAFEQAIRVCTERFLDNAVARYLGEDHRVTPIDWSEFDRAAERVAEESAVNLSFANEGDRLSFILKILSETFSHRNR